MPNRATVHDVARQAQVKVQEVVNVMLRQEGTDRLVRERILSAMHDLNFPLIPVQQEQLTLGLIGPDRLNGQYIEAVIEGVTQACQQAACSLRFHINNTLTRDYLPHFLSDPHLFAVLLVSPDYYSETLDICRHYRLPTATFSYQDNVDLSDVLLLRTNNRQSIVNAVDHLVHLGHQRIGFIAGYLTNNDAIERYQGYQDGLDQFGLTLDEGIVYEGNFQQDSGYTAAMSILRQSNPPSAIVASNDAMAIGAMQAAQELGLQLTRDLSIIGFDDVPDAAHLKPALTTMAQPYHRMAAAAVEGLQKMAAGEKLDSYDLRMEANFVIRESTAPAHAHA